MTPDWFFRILGDRWLRLGVLMLVLAALAHQVSLVIWQLVPEPEVNFSDTPISNVQGQAAATVAASFQQQAGEISRAFLFGKPEVKKAVQPVVTEAPKTELKSSRGECRITINQRQPIQRCSRIIPDVGS